jgi:peroxiredoxin
LWRNDRSDHFVVLGVDTGPDAAGDGRRFVKAHGITYPVVFDPNANVASSRYAASNLPVTYVLNPRGRIIGGQILGPVSEQPHSQALMRYISAATKS